MVASFSSLAFVGCIDHLNNARVRGADEFECKRDEVQVTEVGEHVFVARGCGQVGAYRCEAGLEGGCKKIQGKAGDKAIALAPEAEADEGDKPKKKKKKVSAEPEDGGDKAEKKAKDDDSTTTKKGDSAEKPKKEESSSSSSSSDDDAEKPKKKKKKSEDE